MDPAQERCSTGSIRSAPARAMYRGPPGVIMRGGPGGGRLDEGVHVGNIDAIVAAVQLVVGVLTGSLATSVCVAAPAPYNHNDPSGQNLWSLP